MDLKNISIGAKIIGMATFLLLAMFIIMAEGLFSMNSIGLELDEIAERDMPLTALISTVAVNQLEQAVHLERALRHGEVIGDHAAEKQAYEQAMAGFKEHSTVVDKTLLEAQQLTHDAMKTAHIPAAKQEFTRVMDKLDWLTRAHQEYEQMVESINQALEANAMDQALVLAGQLESKENQIAQQLEGLLHDIERFTQTTMVTVNEHEHSAMATMLVIAVAMFVLGALVSFSLTRSIKKSLGQAVDAAKTIAAGDLTHHMEVKGNDELAQLLNEMESMRGTLQRMIMNMNISSNELASAAEELACASEQSNQAIHQQQTDMDQIASAMTEMVSTVNEVAGNANTTAQSATEADGESTEGKLIVDQTIVSIQELSGGIESAASVIRDLQQQTNNISSVMDVIKSIAEQTNLLALNAAIEAARAGEQGRGFAVVADEVRTLASRTQNSTQEIEEMIAGLQGQAHSAVKAMESGSELAHGSVERAIKAGDSLAVITRSVTTINDMNMQIANAAEEQACVVEDLNKNVLSIKVAGEQTAAATNQTTAASEELARMASQLQQMVAQFKVA